MDGVGDIEQPVVIGVASVVAIEKDRRAGAREKAAEEMDDMYEGNPKPQEFSDSVGESLNLGVNELTDVLHTFYLNVVAEDEDGG